MSSVVGGMGSEGLWVDNQMRRHRIRVMLAITVGYGMYYTCRLGLSVVKKPLIDEGIFTITELGFLGSALFYGYAFGKFFNGFLADHIRPKLFFAAGLALSAVANMAMGWWTVIALSMVIWAINGWFQGFGAPSSVVTLTNWFSKHERGRFYGIWSGGHFIGEGITFYVVAAIVAALGWRYGFWVPGVLCLATAAWSYAFLQNKPTSLGLPSVANWKNDLWEPERPRKVRPSIWSVQRSIFKIPALWILALSSALMYVTRYAINSWGILYLQEVRGYSLVEAGFFLSIHTIAGLVGAISYGFISDKLFDARRPPSNLLFAIIEVAALVLIFFGPDNQLALSLGFLLYGIGLSGLLTAIGGLFAVDIAPSRVAGAAMGFIGVYSYLGAAVQESISARLIEAGVSYVDGVRVYNFDDAIFFWIACSVVSMVLAASLWNARVRD